MESKIFSNLEILILTNLQGKMKIVDLAEQVYKGKKNKPAKPNVSVTTAIANINMKCKREQYNWYIGGDKTLGRQGKTVWYVKKNG